MVKKVRKRLPRFTKEQSLTVQGSFDFLGLNYYTSNYASDIPCKKNDKPSYLTDSCANLTTERNGIPIGRKVASDWLYVYPKGIRDLLLYVKHYLNNPVIYITWNGVDEINDGKLSLKDNMRIEYYKSHLSYVQRGIMEGVKMRGYFARSFMDNFKSGDGYIVRFGSIYVDYKDGLKRNPKKLAMWFKDLLH